MSPAASRPLEVRVLSAGQESVVVLAGELDIATATLVAHEIAPLVAEATELVIDVSALSFADATGLSALYGPARELRARGGRLVLRHPTRMVRKVIDLLRLEEFEIE